MFIYKISNLINGKVYIGKTEKTIQERWEKHISNAERKVNRYLYDAINKYGKNNFKIEEIERCKVIEELNSREIWWISFYKSMKKPFGYNMQEGGTGGRHNEEVTKRIGKVMSIKLKGRYVSEMTRQKISARNKGRVMSQANRDKLRKFCLETGRRPPINHWSGINHPMYGKTHTMEARKRMGATRFEKTYEEVFGEEKARELKEKRSISWLGTKNPRYKNVDKIELRKLVDNQKKVIEIAKYFNVSPPTIITKFKEYYRMKIESYRGRINKRRHNKPHTDISKKLISEKTKIGMKLKREGNIIVTNY